jgi:hypothetical protein
MPKKLPFGLVSAPRVADTKATCVDIDDHLGKSSIHVNTWWSGEGVTVAVDPEKGERQQFDLSWQEYDALRAAIKAIRSA